MKIRILLFLSLLFCTGTPVLKAQGTVADFNYALSLYADHDYAGALTVFQRLSTSEATLFQAKSHYALGNYDQVITLVRGFPPSTPAPILQEAHFTLSLTHFQRKEFEQALDILYTLTSQAESETLQQISSAYFEDIASYLSLNQRMHVVRNSRITSVREFVVLNFMSRYDSTQRASLIQALQRANRDADYGRYLNEIQPIQSGVISNFGVAPKGTIYSIGVMLPGFEDAPQDKPVTRGLYNGLLLAADAFNRQNPEQKVYLTFIDTQQESIGEAFTKLTQTHNVDMILGPLYSQEFAQLGQLAERRGIALFAPLANTITIPRESDYLFQVNPSFESRGRKTARYAIQELGLSRFAVMAETGSNGEAEARAFAEEVEVLGGEIVHMFVENFAARGYSVAEYLPWMSSDSTRIDTTKYSAEHLDAVYLPFTGNAASILLDLVLTGLEAYNPSYFIFGNEELGYIEHSLYRISRLKMIYGDTYSLTESDEAVVNFKYDYENRSGVSPNTFSYIGFDIGTYYLKLIQAFVNPANIPHAIDDFPAFTGLSSSIYFGDEQVNQALQFFRLTPTGPVPHQSER
jgi:ABC-type branched-subunit amino acid transport system substrate-binding protein